MGNLDQNLLDQLGIPCFRLESWLLTHGLKQSQRYLILNVDNFGTLQSSSYCGVLERSSLFLMWLEIKTAENTLPNEHRQQEQRLKCTDLLHHVIDMLMGRRTELALVSAGCPSSQCSLSGCIFLWHQSNEQIMMVPQIIVQVLTSAASIYRDRRLHSGRRWWSLFDRPLPVEDQQRLLVGGQNPLHKHILSSRRGRGAEMKVELLGFLHPLH